MSHQCSLSSSSSSSDDAVAAPLRWPQHPDEVTNELVARALAQNPPSGPPDSRPLKEKLLSSIENTVNQIHKGNLDHKSLTTDTLIDSLRDFGILTSTTTTDSISWYMHELHHLMDITNQSFISRMVAFAQADLGPVTLKNLSLVGAFPPSYFQGSVVESMSPTDYILFIQTIRNSIEYAIRLHAKIVATSSLHQNGMRENIDHNLAEVAEEAPEKKPHQLLADYLLNSAAEKGLRRQGGDLYRMVKLADGTCTHFYEFWQDLEKFVWQQAASHVDPSMAMHLTSSQRTPAHMIDILKNVDDPRLPELETKRTLFAYRNGVYDAAADTFYAHSHVNGALGSKVKPIADLANSFACANYFKSNFVLAALYQPPEDIPTAHFDSVLLTQDFDKYTIGWYYCLLGRMLYDVGECDDWQVCLYLTGVAGSGKSTLFRVFSEVYTAKDVGYLGDNVSAGFGVEHLLDKLIVLCLDISSGFTLQATRLNSFVSGETMVIDRKYKSAREVMWTSQIAFASNELPPIASNAGSGVRRFLCFRFAKTVKNTDTGLIDKMRKELPMFVVKANRLYLQKLDQFGNVGLWDSPDTLPKMCHDLRAEYQRISEPIAEFLASEHVVFGAQLEVEYKDLGRAYRVFYNSTGLPRPAKHFGHPDFIAAIPRQHTDFVSIVRGATVLVRGLSLA